MGFFTQLYYSLLELIVNNNLNVRGTYWASRVSGLANALHRPNALMDRIWLAP